jgi:hypothetical protein
MADPTPMADPDPRASGSGGIADFPARSIYRALLVRGLEPAEAANLTAYLAGLPSRGVHWTIPEVEAIVRRRSRQLEAAAAAAGADPADQAGPVQLTWQLS